MNGRALPGGLYSPRKTGRRFSSMARRPSLASALWRARPVASSRSACVMLSRSEIARWMVALIRWAGR